MILDGEYVYWILALCIAAPIFILMIVALVIALVKRIKLMCKYKNVKVVDIDSNLDIVNAIGADNILDVRKDMSRITIDVKNIEIVDGNKIKELGAKGVLFVGNQVKCSFDKDLDKIYESLKGNVSHE